MPPAERGPGAPVTTCLGLRRNTTHVVKRELKTGTLGARDRAQLVIAAYDSGLVGTSKPA